MKMSPKNPLLSNTCVENHCMSILIFIGWAAEWVSRCGCGGLASDLTLRLHGAFSESVTWTDGL
jgi:hypothetical protein